MSLSVSFLFVLSIKECNVSCIIQVSLPRANESRQRVGGRRKKNMGLEQTRKSEVDTELPSLACLRKRSKIDRFSIRFTRNYLHTYMR